MFNEIEIKWICFYCLFRTGNLVNKQNFDLVVLSLWSSRSASGVIDCCLNTNTAIFQLYHDKNRLIFNEMMMRSTLYKINTLSWIFIMLAHWNNSPQIDISLHSDTLFWLRAIQSLLFLLNAACLAEKQQIPIL